MENTYFPEKKIRISYFRKFAKIRIFRIPYNTYWHSLVYDLPATRGSRVEMRQRKKKKRELLLERRREAQDRGGVASWWKQQ